jgi:sorbitol-specific phosphotransferase system component IIA
MVMAYGAEMDVNERRVCTHASSKQVQQQLGYIGHGVRNFEGDTVQTNTHPEFVGRLCEPCVDDNGIRLRFLNREIKRETPSEG